jgi:hypothetical protein
MGDDDHLVTTADRFDDGVRVLRPASLVVL